MAKGGYAGGVKVLVSPEIEFDMNQFRRKCVKLKNTIRDILKSIEDKDVEITLDADVRRAKEKIEDLKDAAEETATLEVDVDKGVATAQLAALSRDRLVNIKPIVDSGAYAAAKSAIDSLSGAGALREALQGMKALTRQATTLKGLTSGMKFSGLVTLGAVATKAAGGVGALVNGFSKLLPLASAMPGLAAGMVAGFAGVKTAVSDAAERLEGLGYSLDGVKKAIGDRAWEQWGDALSNAASTVLPRLEAGMGRVGEAVGKAGKSMLEMVASSKALNSIDAVLGNTSTAIEMMGPGLASITEAFAGLASVGSSFLPNLAQWFNDAADSAARWVEEGMRTGSIAQGIEQAGNAVKALGAGVGDVLGIFGALGTAAETAGISLSGVGVVLDSVRSAMESMAGQQVLVSLFTAASDATKTFSDSCRGVDTAIRALAEGISGIAGPAAQAFGGAISFIAGAITSLINNGGLQEYFIGVSDAMSTLAPKGGELGMILSSLASFAGTAASVLGTVFATALSVLAPIIQRLAPSFASLAETLGGALVVAINALSPVLEYVATLIEMFAAGLSVIPPEIIVAIATAIGIWTAAQWLLNAALLANPITWVVAAIVALIAIIGACVMYWDEITAAVGRFSQGVLSWVGSAWEWMKSAFQTGLDWIKNIWSTAWNWVKTFASNIWNGIKTVIGDAIEWVRNWIQNKITQIRTTWQTIWNTVKTFFSNIWNGIKNTVRDAAEYVRNWIQSKITQIRNTWNTIWTTVKNFFTNTWNNIKNAAKTAADSLKNSIRNGVEDVKNKVRNLPTEARNALGNLGSTLLGAGKSLIRGFINGIGSMFASVRNKLGELTSKLTSWKGPESLDKRILTPAGEYVIQGFIRGLESQYADVRRSLERFTKSLEDDMKVNVSPTVGLNAGALAVDATAGAAGSVSAGSRVTVNQYYPVAQEASEVRDEVARGLRLASMA